jgi:molybdopterin-guanine dinucleotide biosynthesis protein A
MKSRELMGLVLAGGRSVRMGTDKANLVHPDGRTLARRTYDLLEEAGCESVVISLRYDQEIPAGFSGITGPVIARDPEGSSEGPLSGLLSSMRLHPDANWLVLACDLPRLDAATLKNLISSKRHDEPFLSYRSEFDGLPEPLCALYGEGSLDLLERASSEGLRCPRKLLIRHGCRLLEPVTPKALENANTPSDWAGAIQP